MTERWTHPPVVPSELPPAWRAVWRFRLGTVLLLTALLALAVLAYRQFSGATAQDPGVSAGQQLTARPWPPSAG